MNIYSAIFITLFAALIASCSQLLFKKSMKNEIKSHHDLIAILKDRMIILGLLGYGASLAVYLYALSSAQLSIIYTIFASSFIFTTILSAFILREKITYVRMLGISLIFFGVAIVTLTAGV